MYIKNFKSDQIGPRHIIGVIQCIFHKSQQTKQTETFIKFLEKFCNIS